ncbi:cytochrome c oxidase assembly protein [Streptomyces thermolineatus]|uniref:cytochrome c oxidase assembly protein n=1 Tax=Streptomyces thermolineatus TaxID=44033 RepID=UPI003CD09B5C
MRGRRTRRAPRAAGAGPFPAGGVPHPAACGRRAGGGGLWALCRTGLWAGAAEHPWLHAPVHVHTVVTGVLFDVSLPAPDPLRHRPGPVRGAAACRPRRPRTRSWPGPCTRPARRAPRFPPRTCGRGSS